MSESPRSAAPAAAVGILCLGVVPLVGGPEQPLHWATTAGMMGFGVLLAVRHRMARREQPLRPLTASEGHRAGQHLLGLSVVIALLVAVIFGFRIYSQQAIATLSWLMPAAGLAWLGWLSAKLYRLQGPPDGARAASGDRPSRRPPGWEPRPSQPPQPASGPSGHPSL